MQILRYPATDEILIDGTAPDYALLAHVVAAGGGVFLADATATDEGAVAIPSVHVFTAPDQKVVISLAKNGSLHISGDLDKLSILADNLAGIGQADDGGHQHFEGYAGHVYMAEESLPLVANYPLGGMPL